MTSSPITNKIMNIVDYIPPIGAVAYGLYAGLQKQKITGPIAKLSGQDKAEVSQGYLYSGVVAAFLYTTAAYAVTDIATKLLTAKNTISELTAELMQMFAGSAIVCSGYAMTVTDNTSILQKSFAIGPLLMSTLMLVGAANNKLLDDGNTPAVTSHKTSCLSENYCISQKIPMTYTAAVSLEKQVVKYLAFKLLKDIEASNNPAKAYFGETYLGYALAGAAYYGSGYILSPKDKSISNGEMLKNGAVKSLVGSWNAVAYEKLFPLPADHGGQYFVSGGIEMGDVLLGTGLNYVSSLLYHPSANTIDYSELEEF